MYNALLGVKPLQYTGEVSEFIRGCIFREWGELCMLFICLIVFTVDHTNEVYWHGGMLCIENSNGISNCS